MRIVFASQNKHKIAEIAAVLPKRFELIPMKEAGIDIDIPETGSTIIENSILKAKHLSELINDRKTAVIADDSGLEVEALHGAPGVYSARYAGISKSDEANNKKLLGEMQKATNRKARFVTIITLIQNGEVHTFEGEAKGTIAHEPKGIGGFGYDPLFIPTGYRSTFAELGNEIKNKISHRSQAVNKLVQFLKGHAREL
jgi:XTP/dITP diphosphohydrolase